MQPDGADGSAGQGGTNIDFDNPVIDRLYYQMSVHDIMAGINLDHSAVRNAW